MALLEWRGRNDLYGGNYPNKGEEVAGHVESYGLKTLRNVTTGSRTIVRVEEYGLSRSRAIERHVSHCLYQEGLKALLTAEGLYAVASALAQLDRVPDHEAAMRRLHREFPQHTLARRAALHLAYAAFRRSQWEEAVTLGRDAAQSEEEKTRAEGWLLKGEAELKLKRFYDAVKSFESVGPALSSEPWVRYRALAGLGLAREELQHFRLAYAAYEPVARNSPDPALRSWAQERLKVVSGLLPRTP